MHWILQENIFSEDGYNRLIETLERFSISHSVHKVIPFIGDLEPEPKIDHKNVICMGSYSMRHYAKRHQYNPGVFDLEPFDFTVQRSHWGDHMLNFDSEIVQFQNIRLSEPKFIRPIEDSKVFAGSLFDPEEMQNWIQSVVELGEDYGTSLMPETLVQVCSPKTIYAEYRFWIIRGEIITASLYRRGNIVRYSSEVDDRFHLFVNDMIKMWQPHDAFVIDVCDTDDGIKIVEINTLNSAGFYAADIQKLVFSMEESFNL
ncbi:MAG: ATP-grasp domain-containing protein [Candidimonas sp.]